MLKDPATRSGLTQAQGEGRDVLDGDEAVVFVRGFMRSGVMQEGKRGRVGDEGWEDGRTGG